MSDAELTTRLYRRVQAERVSAQRQPRVASDTSPLHSSAIPKMTGNRSERLPVGVSRKDHHVAATAIEYGARQRRPVLQGVRLHASSLPRLRVHRHELAISRLHLRVGDG
jgi:hypothetical protein